MTNNMRCALCKLEENVDVQMSEYIKFGNKKPTPTYDTEPEWEIEYTEWTCPRCGDKVRVTEVLVDDE